MERSEQTFGRPAILRIPVRPNGAIGGDTSGCTASGRGRGLVGTRAWASPVPDKQIEDLQTLLSQETPVAFHPFLHEGQRVRVRGGCLDGIEGILIERLSDRDLVISVEPIQRSVTVRVTDYDVEPV